MEPVHPFLIISFFNLLSACSEINSHFNQKEISQNRILHHARKPLDGDDCLVVFINRISMLHQNSYGFLDSIHVFYIRNFAIFIFYRTQLRNLRRMSLIVLLVIFFRRLDAAWRRFVQRRKSRSFSVCSWRISISANSRSFWAAFTFAFVEP